VRSNYGEIDAVVPLSGTALWADVWVQPASVATNSNPTGTSTSPTPPADAKDNASLTKQWIEFCWQPQSAKEISVLSHAASPMFASADYGNLPNDIRENRLLLPDSSVLEKSEFIEPLPQDVSKEYEKLWTEIRSVTP
jgi:putative spermidine/putrescine transport system substrate-binding protein